MKKLFTSILIVVFLMTTMTGTAFADVTTTSEEDLSAAMPGTIVAVTGGYDMACPEAESLPDEMQATVTFNGEEVVAEGISVVRDPELAEFLDMWIGMDETPVAEELLNLLKANQEGLNLVELYEALISELGFIEGGEEEFYAFSANKTGGEETSLEDVLFELMEITEAYEVALTGVSDHYIVDGSGLVVTSELVQQVKEIVIDFLASMTGMELEADATVEEILATEVPDMEGMTLYDMLTEDMEEADVDMLDEAIVALDEALAMLTSEAYQGTVVAFATLTCECAQYTVYHEYYVETEEGELVYINQTTSGEFYDEMWEEYYNIGTYGDVIDFETVLEPVYEGDEYTFIGGYDNWSMGDDPEYWDEYLLEELIVGETDGDGAVLRYVIAEEDFSGNLDDYLVDENPWGDEELTYTIYHEYWAEVDGVMEFVDTLAIYDEAVSGTEIEVTEDMLINSHKGGNYEVTGYFDVDVETGYEWDERWWDEYELESPVFTVAEPFDGIIIRYVTTDEVEYGEEDVWMDEESYPYDISHEFWLDVDGEMIPLDLVYNDEYGYIGDVVTVSEDEYILNYRGYEFEVTGIFDDWVRYNEETGEELMNWDDRDWDTYEMDSFVLGEDFTSGLVVRYVAVVETEEPPVEDEPVIDEPIIDEPIIDEPVIDEPVVDEPTVDEPVVEEPPVEEPPVEDTVVEVPKTGDSLESSAMLFVLSMAALLTVLAAKKKEN